MPSAVGTHYHTLGHLKVIVAVWLRFPRAEGQNLTGSWVVDWGGIISCTNTGKKQKKGRGNQFFWVSVLCFVPTVLMCMWWMCSTRCISSPQPARAAKAASYCSKQCQRQSWHIHCPAAPGLGLELLQGHGQQLSNAIPTALWCLMALKGYRSDPMDSNWLTKEIHARFQQTSALSLFWLPLAKIKL